MCLIISEIRNLVPNGKKVKIRNNESVHDVFLAVVVAFPLEVFGNGDTPIERRTRNRQILTETKLSHRKKMKCGSKKSREALY